MPSRILVVDDDARVARPLIEVLAYHGHDVTYAGSGEDALARLAAGQQDLVLLDVRLPGLSGLETCIRIRERHGPALPILMLTAFPDQDLVRAGYEAGADDFLEKPVDIGHLVLKVKACLRLKTLHDEMDAHRAVAQARARDLARLHEIGRDWSLIAEPAEFHRMVTGRLAALIGAPICLLALYDPAARSIEAALPVHGLSDEAARRMRYPLRPEHGAAWMIVNGRSYVSNHARTDPRLIAEAMELTQADSIVLVPMVSEGEALGALVAINKPGGFTDADVQLLTIFAGPAASFLRSRQIFDKQRRHAARLERVAALIGAMAGETGRASLVRLVVERLHSDLGYDRAAFHAADGDAARLEADAGETEGGGAAEAELLRWAMRSAMPLQAPPSAAGHEVAVPVHAGADTLGVLEVRRRGGGPLGDEELNLLSAIAGQLALALQKAAGLARTERLAGQLTTLYDLGLETTALRDLRAVFAKGSEEAGRLIRADHTSVMRLDAADTTLRIFAAWSRDTAIETYDEPVFRLGQGVAGRVARELRPAMVNDTGDHPDFVHRRNPVSRLLCVPLLYHGHGEETPTVFGVLNATRRPGAAAFTQEDLEYLTRFAGQLSIAVSNSMAFAAERERSEQLVLVNTLLREISGTLSRERIMETAVRRIQEAFHHPVVAISVAEQDTYRIAAVATRTPWRDETRTFPIHSGIAGRAYREKRIVHVPDVSKDPDYIALVPSSASEVALPIRAGDDVIAVLNVEKAETGGFDHGQVITLQTLADGIGVVLRNAELYQAVEATNAKLVELDRMKSELVNIVAHDFRAPLAGVLGHAELLEWRPDAPREERIEEARLIIHAATHMASLVEKTLMTTRLESGQLPFEFGVFDLAAMVRDVALRQPERSTHPLVIEGAGDDPVACWGDRDRMAEVLENLISNAVKYSPEGGPVTIEVAREAGAAVVKVTDRGLGIEASDFGRLFRPFSRVRTPRTAQIQGSGLGLYICDRIVRAHGGRLTVESRPGEGSAFAFAVPLFGAEAQTRPPVILVAAGDEGTRRELRRVAEEHGYVTHDVTDGVDAVEAALRLVPAAVVLDRVMPRLGAGEVAERLKGSPATESVPLFVLAEDAELGERSSLFAGFVPRPLDRDRLAGALTALKSKQSQDFARRP
jgi:signal transduction histidine kinase/DNA-binding response OmpR family regulator